MELQSSPEYWSNLNQLCNLIEPRLNKAFRDALKNFNTHHGPILYLYRKGDMANAMHIHIRDGVRRHFAGLSWAHVVDESNSAFMLLIVGHALQIPVILGIKFKKQTKSFKTANIQTQAVVDFNSQQAAFLKYLPQIQIALPIDGITDKVKNPPKGGNVIAGYTPDATWTEYLSLAMTFPLGRGKVRLISEFTHLEVAGEVAEIVEMPRPEETKRTGQIRRRRNTNQPTRTKLRKFIAPDAEGQKTDSEDVKKKGKDGQGS